MMIQARRTSVQAPVGRLAIRRVEARSIEVFVGTGLGAWRAFSLPTLVDVLSAGRLGASLDLGIERTGVGLFDFKEFMRGVRMAELGGVLEDDAVPRGRLASAEVVVEEVEAMAQIEERLGIAAGEVEPGRLTSSRSLNDEQIARRACALVRSDRDSNGDGNVLVGRSKARTLERLEFACLWRIRFAC